MHDDQHGTAIISGAALLNGLEVVEKDISEIKLWLMVLVQQLCPVQNYTYL